jgi:nitrogen fixation NifU-like protein
LTRFDQQGSISGSESMIDRSEPNFDELYREVILDHYRRPRGKAPLACPHISGEGLNPVCGDEVKVALEFDGDHIKDVSVTGRGCAISTASGSMLAELLPGRSVSEVEELVEGFRGMMHDEGVPKDVEIGDLDALEGVKQFPVRIKCALLSWVTLTDALRAWKDGQDREKKGSTTEQEGGGGFSV